MHPRKTFGDDGSEYTPQVYKYMGKNFLKGTQCKHNSNRHNATNLKSGKQKKELTLNSKFMFGYFLWWFGLSVHFLLFSVPVFVGVKIVEENAAWELEVL